MTRTERLIETNLPNKGFPRTGEAFIREIDFKDFYRIHLAKVLQCLIIEAVPRCARARFKDI